MLNDVKNRSNTCYMMLNTDRIHVYDIEYRSNTCYMKLYTNRIHVI